MVQASILFGKEAQSLEAPSLEMCQAPTVYTGQRARAAVRIYHDERMGPMFDTVQILLKGQVHNVIKLDAISWKIEKPLVRMSCVRELEDFSQKPSGIPNSICCQSGFFFDIPETITLPSAQSSDSKLSSQPLPPSIRVIKKSSNDWLVGKTSGVCDVAYHIEARFFLNGRLVSDVRREVIVMPVAELPSPLDPESLKQEYLLTATSTFASFWKRRNGTVLFGSCNEPRPFVIQATKRKSLVPGTDLMFNFATRNMIDSKTAVSGPQFTMCEIKMTLVATTNFQQYEQSSVLSSLEISSLADARNTTFAVLKTNRYKPQIRKMQLKEWKNVKQVTSGRNHLTEWTTRTAVTALIPADMPRLPSFFSALVSRRYYFEVEVRFGTKNRIPAQRPMRLRIPVQMVHAGLEKGWGGAPEAEFDDDPKVPAYVP